MNFRITFFLVIASIGSVLAQQRAQFTQYMNNNYMLNPAAGGTEDYVDIKACFRKQWVNIEGSPTTYYLSGHSPIGKWRGKPNPARDRYKSWHSLGGILYNDVTGPTSRFGASASYGYNLVVASNLRVSMAASIGLQQYTLDGNKLNYHDPGELITVQRRMVPDITVGAWVYNSHVYAGLAASQLLQNDLNFDFSQTGQSENSKLNNHYFLTGGIRLPVAPDFNLVPSIMFKYVNPAPISIDLNAKLKYQDLLWAGVSYRNLDSFIGMVGVTINKWIDIGYSYDATISGLGPYTTGSHEILVGVRLRPKSRLLCPSNFW